MQTKKIHKKINLLYYTLSRRLHTAKLIFGKINLPAFKFNWARKGSRLIIIFHLARKTFWQILFLFTRTYRLHIKRLAIDPIRFESNRISTAIKRQQHIQNTFNTYVWLYQFSLHLSVYFHRPFIFDIVGPVYE
jgi:hypothetical protein